MDPRTWQQAKRWLVEAAALPDTERAAFLAARCPDGAVRRELLEMLASEGILSGILPGAALTPGTRLGPYEIGAVIGAGGMGEVYRARDGRATGLRRLDRGKRHLQLDQPARQVN